MPQLAPDVDQNALMEELRRRGQLSSGGAIRAFPLGPGQGFTNPGVGVTDTPPPPPDPTATDPGAGELPPDVPPDVANAVANAPDEDEGTWNWLLPLIGAGAAYALYKALGKRPPASAAAAGGLPSAPAAGAAPGIDRGTTAEFDTARGGAAGAGMYEGEFTEVTPERQALLTALDPAMQGPTPAAGAIAQQLALPAPPPTLEDKGTPPKYLTATEIARRKAIARRGATPITPSGPPIELKDAFSDFSDEEIAKAWAQASDISKQRYLGDKAKREQVKKYGRPTRRAGRPTSVSGTGDAPEDIIGNIARALRENRALKSQQTRLRTLIP